MWKQFSTYVSKLTSRKHKTLNCINTWLLQKSNKTNYSLESMWITLVEISTALYSVDILCQRHTQGRVWGGDKLILWRSPRKAQHPMALSLRVIEKPPWKHVLTKLWVSLKSEVTQSLIIIIYLTWDVYGETLSRHWKMTGPPGLQWTSGVNVSVQMSKWGFSNLVNWGIWSVSVEEDVEGKEKRCQGTTDHDELIFNKVLTVDAHVFGEQWT